MRSIWAASIVGVIVVIVGGNATVRGQIIADPSFEAVDVPAGSSVTAPIGAWQWTNDAGVVRPVLPNSSNGPLDHTASGVFDPIDGAQYATTYATLDSIRQTIEVAVPGDYYFSVWAASPPGTLTIPGIFTDRPLASGGFQLEWDGDLLEPVHMLDPGSEWRRYESVVSVPAAGEYSIGVRNVVSAPYFINYDAFSFQIVPEPAVSVCTASVALWGLVWALYRRG